MIIIEQTLYPVIRSMKCQRYHETSNEKKKMNNPLFSDLCQLYPSGSSTTKSNKRNLYRIDIIKISFYLLSRIFLYLLNISYCKYREERNKKAHQ